MKAVTLGNHREGVWQYVKRHPLLYLMLLPGCIYFIVFHYIPMYGVVIAFQDFKVTRGLFGSEWVGLENFRLAFSSSEFYRILKNSLCISLLRIIFGFPAPIILALLLNELRSVAYKRVMQTVMYLPHFVSWVIAAGLVMNLLASDGVVNMIIKKAGGQTIMFMQTKELFWPLIVITDIWKSAGWGAIVYLAALTGIDPQLYEAARIDGANRLQCVFRISLPCITNTIVILLILRMGGILCNGFEQIWLLSNATIRTVSDVFETYNYRVGLIGGRMGYTAAIGMFQSIVGLVLIFSTNLFARSLGERGLF